MNPKLHLCYIYLSKVYSLLYDSMCVQKNKNVHNFRKVQSQTANEKKIQQNSDIFVRIIIHLLADVRKNLLKKIKVMIVKLGWCRSPAFMYSKGVYLGSFVFGSKSIAYSVIIDIMSLVPDIILS